HLSDLTNRRCGWSSNLVYHARWNAESLAEGNPRACSESDCLHGPKQLGATLIRCDRISRSLAVAARDFPAFRADPAVPAYLGHSGRYGGSRCPFYVWSESCMGIGSIH